MKLRAVAFYTLTWIYFIRCSSLSPQDCDDGEMKVEMDLPQAGELVCGGDPWPSRTRKLLDISTKHPLQPAEHVCMDEPITYHHTIPNSGAHRPVGAESGEYLYCPPQRWVNNLKDGATVLLYHPCVSEEARNSLAVVAQSCLHHYILTPHPQLSKHRPFALVSWGHTLEMSHITTAGLCEWLVTTNSKPNQSSDNQRPKYSLYLIKAAPGHTALGLTSALSNTNLAEALRVCCVEALAVNKREKMVRKSRAAGQPAEGKVAKEHEVKLSENDESTKLNSTHTQLPKAVEDRHTPTALLHEDKNTHKTVLHAASDRGAVQVTQQQVVTSGPKEGTKSHQHHRIKASVEEQGGGGDCRSPGGCGVADEVTPVMGEPPHGQRIRTPRTDEAVWAAAALGFLFVLLTLSVLHTRLYRNWRTPPSLYWHETQQDYDSVADIIRRRLRMVGRRKRRVSQSRRQECPLLPNSSTDNDSD